MISNNCIKRVSMWAVKWCKCQRLHLTLNIRNSKAAKINTGRRWKDIYQQVPGPGTYTETGNCATGSQVVSTFHSTLTKNLKTTEARTKWGGNPRFKTPGPGSYRPPSDFGYLDFKSQLRDNLNSSLKTGFNTSMADPKESITGALLIDKNDSIHSARKSNRNRRHVSC